MNRRQLILACAIVALAMMLSGCGAKAEMADVTANPWVATQILTSEGHTAVLNGSKPAIYFREDGNVVGNATVNTFRGPYTLEARNVTIGPLVATEWSGPQMESAQDQLVLNALKAASRYVVKNGELRLSDSTGELLMTLQVAEEPVLVGPNWIGTAIASESGTLSSVVGSAPVSAAFAPDGTLEGFSGVNQYSATYTAAGSQMTVGPEITSTKMAGAEPLMAQESRYLEALANTESFKIEQYQLTLLDKSGAAVLVFVPGAPKM